MIRRLFRRGFIIAAVSMLAISSVVVSRAHADSTTQPRIVISKNANRTGIIAPTARAYGGKYYANISGIIYPNVRIPSAISSVAPVAHVTFGLEKPDGLFSIDHSSPYDLGGTDASGKALPWNTARLTNGTHTIFANVTLANGAKYTSFVVLQIVNNATRYGPRTGATIANAHSATNAQLAARLDAVANTGAKWIRLDFFWAAIQQDGPTSYNWSPNDRVVRMAQARGLSVLAVMAYAPRWAQVRSCVSACSLSPDKVLAYAEFTKKVAQRYGPGGSLGTAITAYEIWNEQNISQFWFDSPNVALYTQLLKASYPKIHDVVPTATVLTGGFSPATNSANSIAPADFLRGIYANGGKGFFDAVAHHPYSFPYSPNLQESWNPFQQTTLLHQIMSNHGEGEKKVWGTEIGFPTAGRASAVTEQQQSRYVEEALRSWNAWSFTGPLFFWTFDDIATGSANYIENFGLLRDYSSGLSPKPALVTFVNLM